MLWGAEYLLLKYQENKKKTIKKKLQGNFYFSNDHKLDNFINFRFKRINTHFFQKKNLEKKFLPHTKVGALRNFQTNKIATTECSITSNRRKKMKLDMLSNYGQSALDLDTNVHYLANNNSSSSSSSSSNNGGTNNGNYANLYESNTNSSSSAAGEYYSAYNSPATVPTTPAQQQQPNNDLQTTTTAFSFNLNNAPKRCKTNNSFNYVHQQQQQQSRPSVHCSNDSIISKANLKEASLNVFNTNTTTINHDVRKCFLFSYSF